MILRNLMTVLAVSFSLSFASAAMAGSIVAIVEDIKSNGTSVAFMDYLTAGRKISLGRKGRLVLGYLNSCLRETIVGGTVTIGAEKSVVKGGKINRERVECDGGRLLLTAEEAGKSAVVVFRKGATKKGSGSPRPSLRIYSLQPVIQVKVATGTVTIKRLDLPKSTVTIMVRNGLVDFATQDRVLERGGLYRISSGSSSRVVRVDSYAARGGSLISRLIAL
jgi:hypothetical protein